MPFQRFLHLVVEEAVKEGEKDSLSRRLFSVMEENGRSEFSKPKVNLPFVHVIHVAL